HSRTRPAKRRWYKIERGHVEVTMPFHPTRRRLLVASTFAAAHLVLDDALAQPLQPTPQCHDGDAPTTRETEAPFSNPSSPRRTARGARPAGGGRRGLGGLAPPPSRGGGRGLLFFWGRAGGGDKYATAASLSRAPVPPGAGAPSPPPPPPPPLPPGPPRHYH